MLMLLEGMLLDETVVGLWYVHTLPDQDFLALLKEVEPDKEYDLQYRFRYYRDNDVFGSKDEKYWYRFSLKTTKERTLEGIRLMVKSLLEVAVEPMCEILNDKGIKDFEGKLTTAPFAHPALSTNGEVQPLPKDPTKFDG